MLAALCILTGQPANNFLGYVRLEALKTTNDEYCKTVLVDPRQVKKNSADIQICRGFVPVFCNDSILTVKVVELNAAYGESNGFEYDYRSFITRGDKTNVLSAADILKPGVQNHVKKFFLNRFRQKLIDDNADCESYGLSEIYINFSLDAENDHETLRKAFRAGNYSPMRMPRISVIHDGVIFSFKGEYADRFYDYEYHNFLVNFDDIKKYLRPGWHAGL